MKEPPTDKSPVCSVPQTTDTPNNIDIADNFPFVAPAAAKREINVVTKPGCQ